MSRPRTAAALALVLALAAPRASAHQSSVVYSDIVVHGREVTYKLQLASTDLYEAVGVDRDRPVSKDEVLAGRARLLRYLVERVHVATGGADCPASPAGLGFDDATDGFFAVVTLEYRCPRLIADATVQYDLFFDVDPRHQGIARISFDDGEPREQVFRADRRTVSLRRDLSAWDHARDYLGLGVEHIFTGYDHLAFLFGLLVVAGAAGLRAGARKVLAIVTAFTVAHSITLIAAALGWVVLPSRLVEPAIALSIAYVGVENLVHPQTRRRWLLTFAFGLVHGFGFASVLREIGLPEKGLVLSLVSFNLGVELGQLAVVAAVLPLLAFIAQQDARPAHLVAALLVASVGGFFLLRRFDVAPAQLAVVCFGVAPAMTLAGRRFGYDRVVRVGASVAITALAVLWLFERVIGRSFLGGQLG